MSEKDLNVGVDGELINPSEIGVDVSGYEAYSNTTTNYDLPLIAGRDKYSPLTTWNPTMEKIDETMFENATGNADNEASLKALQNESERQDRELEEIRKVDVTQSNLIAGLTGSVAELKTDIDDINGDLVEQNALIKNLTNRVIEGEDNLKELSDTVDEHWSDGSTNDNTPSDTMPNNVLTQIVTKNSGDILQANGKINQNTNNLNRFKETYNNSGNDTPNATIATLPVSMPIDYFKNKIGDACEGFFVALYLKSGPETRGASVYMPAGGSPMSVNVGSITVTIRIDSDTLSISGNVDTGSSKAFITGLYSESTFTRTFQPVP